MDAFRGGCECGHIRYVVRGEPSSPHYCHCRRCQRLSGAPVVAWVDFPLAALSFEGAEPARYRQASGATDRGFCPKCGGSIFAQDDGSALICLTIVSLDDPNLVPPEYESFKESAPDWLELASPGEEPSGA